MTFEKLRLLQIPFFPKSAGWYYQQFLKLGVSFLEEITDNYVVLDADTIFLKQPEFFDEHGRFIFVKAEEYHKPYFDTYEKIIGEKAKRDFSFISQYMIFNKTIVQEMCLKIESNFNNIDSWNWHIIKNLIGDGGNLFSEYETYGHYIKANYAERGVFVDIPWLRDGSQLFKSTFPSSRKIESLASQYNFVSIELKANSVLGKFKKKLFSKFYPRYKYLMNALSLPAH